MDISPLLILVFVSVLHHRVHTAPESWFSKILPVFGMKAVNPAPEPTTPLEEDEYGILSQQKVAVLSSNVKGYEMEGMRNTVAGAFFKFTVQKYKKPGTEECFKLVTIRKLLEDDVLEEAKISCEYEMPQTPKGAKVRFEGVIYERKPSDVMFVIKDGICINIHYGDGKKKEETLLSEQKCEAVTKRTKAERMSGYLPGTEPLTTQDIALMDRQIVAVLKGTLKDFKETKCYPPFLVQNIQVDAKECVLENQCVRVVSIKRTDINEPLDEIKMSCKVTGPMITDDEDILLNYGNIVYLRDFTTAVFITKDGGCLQRSYHLQWGKVVHHIDSLLSLPDCYQLTRWSLSRRKSGGKLNKNPPPKSIGIPGLMWLLTMNGDTGNFKPVKMDEPQRGGVFEIQTQQFFRGDEECIRLLVIRVHGAEAERVTVSCGPTKNLQLNGLGILYGKAFSFKPQLGTDDFEGIYNLLRDGSCTKITYTVERGDPAKIKKSNSIKVLAEADAECKELIEGKGIHTNVVIPPFDPCASLGWLGGAFTKLISSIGG